MSHQVLPRGWRLGPAASEPASTTVGHSIGHTAGTRAADVSLAAVKDYRRVVLDNGSNRLIFGGWKCWEGTMRRVSIEDIGGRVLADGVRYRMIWTGRGV